MIAFLGTGLIDLLCWLIVVPLLGYLGYRSFVNSDSRRELVIKWVVSAVLLLIIWLISLTKFVFKPLLCLIPAVLIGLMWTSNICNILFRPLTGIFDGEGDENELKPFYFRAEAKRRKGLHQEAVAEVRRQLALFPGDIEGMMKLASLQAEELHDLPAATQTLNELVQQPGLPANNAFAALQTLADWQINLGRDTDAARKSFERIMQMFPNSSFSHNAEQRLAHLEGITKTREFREKAVFKVPSTPRDIGLRVGELQVPSAAPTADALAAEYVKQLEKHPNDAETRQKLAMLYAEEFGRLDLAANQLEQLAALPNAKPHDVAQWLNQLATLHVRYGNDLVAAGNALRRIVERFPKTPDGMRAEARLAALQGELKAAAPTTAAKALGVYEKDLGLKAGSASTRLRG
ncbi:MAG TPA: tetratricopeptide repeat protein [Candidatus Cybelea sp.]|nr:tetratricopeptide repeat protein [Candidatus Cybelea sp.]